MPTYTVSTEANRLTPRQKTIIAQEITRIHSAVTGAPVCFAQVFFADITPGNRFVGGKPLQNDLIFLHASIRAGRTSEQKETLLLQLAQVIALTAQAPRNAVWAYVHELPHNQMIEFGHLLPAPGSEEDWFQALPLEDRNLMDRIGR